MKRFSFYLVCFLVFISISANAGPWGGGGGTGTALAPADIVAYTNDASPTDDDLLPTVNDPTSPALRKVTLAALKTYILGAALSPALGGTGVANDVASTITISGAFGLTLTISADTSLALPTGGTVLSDDGSAWSDEHVLCAETTAGEKRVKSCGAKIDLSTTISQNVETSGYLAGKMRAIIVAVPSGVQDGGDDAALMTDGGIDLGADTLIGMTVYNVTDGSSCTITDNAATTITCTLTGGTDNNWDNNDVWQVGPGPAQSGSLFYVGSAGTIRHPATVGYLAGYYTTAAAAVIINPASDSMVITNATASAIDAGDCVDSPATAGSYIFLHNASAILAYTLGKNGTYTDGGAD